MPNYSDPHPRETESGFIDVKTASGQTLSIFTLNSADFERLAPSEDVYDAAEAFTAKYSSSFSHRPRFIQG